MDAHDNFLSQEEVDALLGAGTAPAAPAPEPSGVRPYDLSSPDRVVRHRMHTLELINERFARRMRNVFFSFIRRGADITAESLRIQKYSDFERHLPVPSNLNMVEVKPLRGSALFTLDPGLVFLVIDSLFGGSGKFNTRVEGRDFSAIEQRIIQRLLRMTLDSYAQAWEPVHRIEPVYVRSETHTKFASITRGNEIVLVSTFHIDFGNTSGKLNVCLPYSMIEPVRDLLTRPLQVTGKDAIDQRWMQQLSHQVRSAEVDLTVEFTKLNLTVAQLMRLAVGDVLPITMPSAVYASAGGIPVLEGTVGTFHQRYAVRVKQVMRHSESQTQLHSAETSL